MVRTDENGDDEYNSLENVVFSSMPTQVAQAANHITEYSKGIDALVELEKRAEKIQDTEDKKRLDEIRNYDNSIKKLPTDFVEIFKNNTQLNISKYIESKKQAKEIAIQLKNELDRIDENKDSIVAKYGIDTLTGLLQKDMMQELFVKTYTMLANSALQNKENKLLVLYHYDIDHFKKGNDTYGHLAMDQVLAKKGEIVNKSCRENDYAFRAGGEEFVIYLNAGNFDIAKTFAERLKNKISDQKYRFTPRHGNKEEDFSHTISLGYTIMQIDHNDAKNLHEIYNHFDNKLSDFDNNIKEIPIEERGEIFTLKNKTISDSILPIFRKMYEIADKATYEAKESGRNKIVKFDPEVNYNSLFSVPNLT